MEFESFNLKNKGGKVLVELKADGSMPPIVAEFIDGIEIDLEKLIASPQNKVNQ